MQRVYFEPPKKSKRFLLVYFKFLIKWVLEKGKLVHRFASGGSAKTHFMFLFLDGILLSRRFWHFYMIE